MVSRKEELMGKEGMKFRETIVLVLRNAKTGKIELHKEIGPNIVTNAGDRYYAQQATGSETPTLTFNAGQMIVAASFTVAATKVATFGRFRLGTFGGSITYNGRQTFDSGYPKTADTDTSNTGRTIDGVTYKVTYGTSDANTLIQALGICRMSATTGVKTTLLSYRTLAVADQVTKTSSQTLTVFVNHVFNGV